MNGLTNLIRTEVRAALTEVGYGEAQVEQIVARVRSELAGDLAPIAEIPAQITEAVDQAVAELPDPEPAPDPEPEPGAAPDQPAPEPEPEAAPEAETPPESPEPKAEHAEAESQPPARQHFLHRNLRRAS